MKGNKKSDKRIFSADIPKELEMALIIEYEKIIDRYKKNDFEHHETSVGKFCEVMLRIFENISTGKFTAIDKPIQSGDIIDEIMGGGYDSSIRMKIAPLIKILLKFRNDRDAAHVGGIDLGFIDTNLTFHATRWIYAEMIRLYGEMDIKQIQQKIDETGEIVYHDILKIGNRKVITKPRLTSEREILLSLRDGEIDFDELFEMNKEQNKTRFRKKMDGMEKRKLIYHDDHGKYYLLPEGDKLLKGQ